MNNNKNHYHLSFEFYPPKTSKGIDNLRQTAMCLAKLNPNFFTVTYGAGGSNRVGTIETVSTIKKLTNTYTVPHLACHGTPKEQLIEIILNIKETDVKQIVALRGDIPEEMKEHRDMHYACDLVSLIRETTGDHFEIFVAAYPECHPQAQDCHQDLLNFKRKIDAGANAAFTQYFFNADAYFDFVERCQKHNISIPIIPGVMPITNFSNLMRFSNLCEAEVPRWIQKRCEAYGDDMGSITQFGFEVVYNLCDKLISDGAPGLHFYTLNQADATQKLVSMLNLKADAAEATQLINSNVI